MKKTNPRGTANWRRAIVIPTAFALIATGVVPAVSHVPEASAAIPASGFSSTATPGVEGGVLMFARQDDGSLYNYLYGKTGFNTRLEFFFDEAAPNYIRIYPDAGVDLSEVKVARLTGRQHETLNIRRL